ncbi:CLUMA_CG001358, isoform A [Clunio marinus]|uniref:CLUMA_CG001358, isoform A n=1 Tax=Clunio marinus TaxID=568069 RepID=A0A1J1HMU5_9DIPT|nr:CLUMA_CG001358, isoform A [Clunio marinus]
MRILFNAYVQQEILPCRHVEDNDIKYYGEREKAYLNVFLPFSKVECSNRRSINSSSINTNKWRSAMKTFMSIV